MNKSTRGFTIVELLIVIVVIAILASISIVSYNGIQGRAYDVAVRSDIGNITDAFELYRAEKGSYPVGSTELGSLGLRVSKSSYGNGFSGGAHNFLYCRITTTPPDRFVLIASSKSGNVLVYSSDTSAVTTRSSWPAGGTQQICQNVGIAQPSTNDRDLFYYDGAWQSYIAG